jgi:hypothetical protein
VTTTEAVSSSLEESNHSKSDTETYPSKVGAFGTNIEVPSSDPHEEIVYITSLSPGVTASATLADPLDISYSELEPESDKDCAPQVKPTMEKSLIPPPSTAEV